MKICVWGMGYVGAVTAACFAKLGHDIIGFDINKKKILKYNQGHIPIKEEGLDVLFAEAVKNKKFVATDDASLAVLESDIIFVCVKTPSDETGKMDISAIIDVANKISNILVSKRNKKHIIVVRSTIPPGTIGRLEKMFKKKGLKSGEDFVIASNPEFLREGSAIKDFFEPSYIVVGADKETADKICSLYDKINATKYKVSVHTAETIKFINNSWHALEMGFVNEVSSICKKLNINSKELLDLFASDTKLNLSSYYLKPNMGYGGSCLPKDLAAFASLGESLDVECPILESISKSNLLQIKRVYKFIKREIEKAGKKEVGILGIAFKPGTDDIRGSPIIYVLEKLKADGFKVKLYDPIVKKEQIENIRNSYRDVIYDPLLSPLMDVKNFKDLLTDIENMVRPLDDVISCRTVVLNATMPQDILNKLKKEQVLIKTREIILIKNLGEIKAKYLEAW
jgi:GDP-mannose 6-dehydrogenase